MAKTKNVQWTFFTTRPEGEGPSGAPRRNRHYVADCFFSKNNVGHCAVAPLSKKITFTSAKPL